LHRLASAFILGYHGCDRRVGERLLAGTAFKPSNNDYDWLGPGIYFWEANRGLEFAEDASRRRASNISKPFVTGAVIELGLCLDLTTSSGLDWVKIAYQSLVDVTHTAALDLPSNSRDVLRRNLLTVPSFGDCTPFSKRGNYQRSTRSRVFTEGKLAYPGAGFREKTHIQIAVRNPRCIKGVVRIPRDQLHS
jgi:hypothetical protein